MSTQSNNGTSNTNTSGESNVALDYIKQAGSDCITDKNMAEIARRLVGFVSSDETGDVIFSVDPPNDTKKIWIEISNTGAIIGTIKRYDSATGQWVDDHTELPDPTEIKRFSETRTMGSDDETLVYNHNFGTTSYGYAIVYTSAPLDTARWYQVNKDINTLELKVLGASGVGVEITIIEIITA
jgi:hypothetical protein